jgi:hypothetical protein
MRIVSLAAFIVYLLYAGSYSVFYIAGLRTETATQEVARGVAAIRSFAGSIPRGARVCVVSYAETAYLPGFEHAAALYALPGREILGLPLEAADAPPDCYVIYPERAKIESALALGARRIARSYGISLARPLP